MIRRLAALAATAALVAAPLVSSQPASGGALAPHGSSGIGDRYFPLDGNGGIDVLSYKIANRYEFGPARLSGHTRIELVATKTMSGFNLDFLLPVKSVRLDGRRVGFHQRSRHELSIDAAVRAGEQVSVVVRYAGHPGHYSYLGERNWLASDQEVVAMNQPHMAPWWFPANDHPLDRADITVAITAPKGKQVISNGHLRKRTVHGALATTTWSADEPMVPYLAFFAAGRFDVAEGVTDGHPWYVGVSRGLPAETRERAMSLLTQSAPYVSWLEDVLDLPYPFSTTGGVVTSLRPGFALENQTRPTYERGSLNVATVIHELAHQWFGDYVAVEGWKDIWLNEGFATFFEGYWDETHGGPTGDEWLRTRYDFYTGDFWRHQVADPCPKRTGCDDVLDIFDSYVYDRGAMTLHALRNVIDDDTVFFEVLRSWVEERGGANGDTASFEALAEDVTGLDLDRFFDVWLHTAEKPADTAANGMPAPARRVSAQQR